ncbi:MAG: hypothetical protein D6B27_06005 [Gammaproteobacteria bacterium]|nr:MAG: hypothetical protein D6B27_06005 [Gammaproteobacteria bacterium]
MKAKLIFAICALFLSSAALAAKPVVTPGQTIVNGNTVTLSGTVYDMDGDIAGVSDLFGMMPCELNNYGYVATYTCSPEVTFEPGYHEITMIAVDAAGNYSDPAYAGFTIEEQESVAPVLSAVVANTTDAENVTITGAVNDTDGDIDSVKVVFGGIAADIACDYEGTDFAGTFTCELGALEAGDYAVNIVAEDAAENTATEVVEFSIGTFNECVTATNQEHVMNGRAYTSGYWFSVAYKAIGSEDNLGAYGFTTTSLQQTGENSWTKVDSCE